MNGRSTVLSPVPKTPPSLGIALCLALTLGWACAVSAQAIDDAAPGEAPEEVGEPSPSADEPEPGNEETPPAAEPTEEPADDLVEDPTEDPADGLAEDPAAGDAEVPAEPGEGDEVADEPGRMMQALAGGQEAVTRGVVGLSRRMDRMLGARETYPDEYYDSLLRARFIQRLDDAGGSRLEPDISGRISLPGAERRWSVIFLSDDFDDPLDRERRTDRELDETTRRSIALRYLQPVDEWQTSASVGLRSGEPIDVLTRLRGWRDFRAGEWGIRPSQSVFWYDERGLGSTSEIRVEHPIDILMLARSDTSATWFKRDEQFYYDQILSLLQPLSPRRGLLWQIGLQAESQPNHRTTRYYVQVRWRALAHRDWLILELRPQIIRERENDFRVERRLYFGFEILFGEGVSN